MHIVQNVKYSGASKINALWKLNAVHSYICGPTSIALLQMCVATVEVLRSEETGYESNVPYATIFGAMPMGRVIE